jgi:hypothetical protein
VTISGYVRDAGGDGVSGVTVTFSDGGGSVSTDGNGFYSCEVPSGWSGTVTPSKGGYAFEPWSRSYNGVRFDTPDQNYRGSGSPPPADPLAEALDTSLSISTGGDADWFRQGTVSYYRSDAAQSGDIGDSQQSWMETTVDGPGRLSFWWKVSSESNWDWLRFSVDGLQQDQISGEVDWQQKTYEIATTGSYVLRWSYTKDVSVDAGSDCGNRSRVFGFSRRLLVRELHYGMTWCPMT